MVLRKDELEVQLKDEHQLICDGVLKDDNPLDLSEGFKQLCNACRVGDLKGCQEAIEAGVNINARDAFDYSPLILASLCGHYEAVRLLLESGALCERDTFQGERCLYNALNNRIRNLLLEYDYSKSTDPLQPLASHITSLFTREKPKTSDICLTAGYEEWNLHKFILSARSPYFQKKLSAAPETIAWKLSSTIPPESLHVSLRYLYLGDVPSNLGLTNKSFVTEDEVLKGIDKVTKELEIESLWESINATDRRIARQRHDDEVTRGRDQLEVWYRKSVLRNKVHVDTGKAQDVKWTRENAIFADVLLQSDEVCTDGEQSTSGKEAPKARNTLGPQHGIPIGSSAASRSSSIVRKPRQSILFPAHRAMLLRSEYFETMFASSFKEAQVTEYLQIIKVDCSPQVMEIVLNFIYTERADIPIDLALDVLYTADMLFIDKLKTKAAIVISTVGMGNSSLADRTHLEAGQKQEVEVEPINVYDVIRAGWLLRVQRLEEFSARYFAYRLEDYIDEEEFEEVIKESASRIQKRQETDSIELLDDIRHFLSARFRLRFEATGLDQFEEEGNEVGLPPEWSEDNMAHQPLEDGTIRTLDGELAGDEFAADAINYQILLGKIDALLERLDLDA